MFLVVIWARLLMDPSLITADTLLDNTTITRLFAKVGNLPAGFSVNAVLPSEQGCADLGLTHL